MRTHTYIYICICVYKHEYIHAYSLSLAGKPFAQALSLGARHGGLTCRFQSSALRCFVQNDKDKAVGENTGLGCRALEDKATKKMPTMPERAML